MRRSIKKESNIAIVAVVAIVLVASVLLIVRPNPEQIVAVSADGLVRLQGVSRPSSTVLIERLDHVATSIVDPIGSMYEMTATGTGTVQNAQLQFLFTEFDSDVMIQEVTVYRFNRESLEWEPVPTFFDLDTQILTAEVEFSGSLLVGLGRHVL